MLPGDEALASWLDVTEALPAAEDVTVVRADTLALPAADDVTVVRTDTLALPAPDDVAVASGASET